MLGKEGNKWRRSKKSIEGIKKTFVKKSLVYNTIYIRKINFINFWILKHIEN